MADYAQTAWVDDNGTGATGTAFTAARLNALEAGVKDAAQNSKQRGAAGARPPASAATKNWCWIDSTTNAMSYCDGAQWIENITGKAPLPVGTRAARPAANVGLGTYFATDIAILYVSDGAAWYRSGDPPGQIVHWPAAAIPAGWALMDGTVFTDQAGDEKWWDLHAIAAVEFTAGRTGFFHRIGLSGVNNWPVDRRLKLKDLRGQTLIGSGQPLNDNGVGNLAGITNRALGALVGVETVALLVAELARHGHGMTGFMDRNQQHAHVWDEAGFGLSVTNEANAAGGNGHYHRGGGAEPVKPTNTDHLHLVNHAGGNTGGNVDAAGAAHQNMQPSVATNNIIRL